MKIAVIGANGKAGRLIVKEALDRGHEVTAIMRGPTAPDPRAGVLTKDLFDLGYADLAPYEVVVDAFGAWSEETLPQHSTHLAHLTGLLAGKPGRLLVVGGAGSLYMDPGHTTRLMDTPDFPEMFLPLAGAMGEALDTLRRVRDVAWTYLSPAADFRAEGARTGRYTLGGEEFFVNAKGASTISYADYAIAMVDLAEQGGHIRERVSVVGE